MSEPEKRLTFAQFFSAAKLNKKKTAEAGRPIYDNVEMVRIKFAGDRNRVLVAPADECEIRHPETGQPWPYKDRFAAEYEAFRAGVEFVGEGTPLSELVFLTEAKRAELRSLNVFTAEQLAAIEGTPLQKLGMGARELKNKAQAYLDKAAGTADVSRMAAEIEALKALIAKMSEGGSAIDRMRAPDPEEDPEELADDEFKDYSDDDLKEMIKNATGRAPSGRPRRETLVSTLRDLAKPEQEAA